MPIRLLVLTFGTAITGAAMASPAGTSDGAQNPAGIAKIEIKARRGASELSYRDYLEIQHQLHRYLPAEPRLVDLWFRASIRGVSEPERDAYAPYGGTVTIRSRSVNLDVPMRHGAYFSLPVIQQAYDEGGDIIVGDGARPWLGVWWTLRVPRDQRMLYADILKARAQIASVQAKISTYAYRIKSIKRAKYNGIKACFHDATGAILLGGIAVADATEGNCKVLFNNVPAELHDATVEFSGPLDVVSFIDSGFYPAARQ